MTFIGVSVGAKEAPEGASVCPRECRVSSDGKASRPPPPSPPPPPFPAQLQQPAFAPIPPEIAEAPPFYYAEAYHQQYLAKTPGGYCGLGGTGVCLPA